MKALRLKSWKSEPVMEDVPVPEPGPGEVLVQVGAAGVPWSSPTTPTNPEPTPTA